MIKKVFIALLVALIGVLIVGWVYSRYTGTKVVEESKIGGIKNTAIANPASVNCKEKGGTTQIVNGPNGQYGLCNFEDDYACEEWALFRGECPVGGVRTTGFDNIEQKYCAWVGGETLAVPEARCTLPSGKVCDDLALYNGECEE